MRVHLLPASNKDSRKHYQDTILNHPSNCRTKEIKKHVSKSISDTLSEKSYALWGVTNGGKNGLLNKRKWLKMQPDDIGFFYRDNKFFSSCLIHEKVHNKDFALQLWGEKYNERLKIYETWENMFLIKDLEELNISIEVYNNLFGYEDGPLMAYRCLDEIESENLLDAFDLISNDKNKPRLKKMSPKNTITSKLVEHKDGKVVLSRKTRSEKEIVIEQKESQLVKRYKKHLKQNNLGTMEKSIIAIDLPDERKMLETDGWIAESKILIEAKASLPVSRSDVRMAIGQLFDYKRHHNPKPDRLAILLPACPSQDLVNLIFSQNIEIIYEKGKYFYHKQKHEK